jgi:hypothetical protein
VELCVKNNKEFHEEDTENQSDKKIIADFRLNKK